jgi:hypothetical protein
MTHAALPGLAKVRPTAELDFEVNWPDRASLIANLVIRSMPSAREALQLLKDGGLEVGAKWQEAHKICQGREGHPDYDWVHALCHAIEGDDGNADYWYRSAGQKRYSRSLELEWQHIHNRMSEPSA